MNERQSNFELLRLVCMLLIIWLHFTGHGIIDLSERYAISTSFSSLFPFFIRGLCLCAVNTFILISGYFSIIPKAKSFFNLYLVCAFYAGLVYLVHLYQSGLPLNRWLIYNTLMPFGLWKSSTDWWFIPNYMILFILSPILNWVSSNTTKSQFRRFLLLIIIPVFYFGWFRNEVWSERGYNYLNFILLYFIGRYIALHGDSLDNTSGVVWVICWFFLGLIIGFLSWYAFILDVAPPWMWHLLQYNNPGCIVASVFLLLSFKKVRIKNFRIHKLINWYAASCLSIYLVHDNAYHIIQPFYDFLKNTYDTQPLWLAYIVMLALSLALMVLIPLFDKLRILMTGPLCRFFCRVWYQIKPKVVSVF